MNQHQLITKLVTEMEYFKLKIDTILCRFKDDVLSQVMSKIEPRKPDIIIMNPRQAKILKEMI